MLSLINSVFITFIYQPFFNLLVYIYLLLDKITVGHGDMGIALIIFTFIFRVILLPLSLSADRSEKEKRLIKSQVEDADRTYKNDPVKRKQVVRSVISSNKKLLVAEIFDVGIQIAVVLMLFRIFKTGLEGADFNLLYSFMPHIDKPFNLLFLGKYDLSQPNFALNVVSSVVIFIAEFLNIRFSPFPVSYEDKLMLLVLPLGAFTYFAFMPAGKKLFVIATLIFSIGLILLKQGIFVYHNIRDRVSGGKKPAWQL